MTGSHTGVPGEVQVTVTINVNLQDCRRGGR